MRDVFRYLTAVLLAAVVVQVALAGYGAFNTVERSDDDGSITKDAVENGFTAHGILGTLILVVMLALVVAAAAGRLGGLVQWSSAIFGLGILQMLFAWIGGAVAALGFLHAVNALVIFAAVAMLAHRVWRRGTAATAPA